MIQRALLAAVSPVLGPVALGAATRILVYVVQLGQVLAVAVALGAVGTGNPQGALPWIAVAATLVVARGAAVWLREVVAARIGARARQRLRAKLLDSIESAGPATLRDKRAGDLLAVAVDGVEGVDAYVGTYLPQAMATVLASPLLLAALATVSPAAALVTGTCLAIVLVVPRRADRRLLGEGPGRWAAFERLSADFLETIQGLATLRVLGAVQHRRQLLVDRTDRLLDHTVRQLRLNLVDLGVTSLFVQVGTVAAIGLAAAGAADAVLVGREAFVVLFLAIECFRPATDLGAAWHAGYLGLTAEPGITRVLGMTSAVPFDGERDEPVRGAHDVVVEDIRLRYDTADADTLAGVSMQAPAGSLVAVVGASGAGKSSLADVIARVVEPAAGRVAVGGTDLRSLTRGALAGTVRLVRQDAYLFPMTITDNIALGDPRPDPGRVAEAARLAGAADFIESLPEGYAAQLGERGRGLSGGQRQRLSVARAIYSGPALLVLDEPTAHLDAASEQALVEGLLRLRGRCTTIVITHRASTAAAADHVVVLADGVVVQRGTPDAVFAEDGPGRDLLQLEGAAA